jgi:hypothetical protein
VAKSHVFIALLESRPDDPAFARKDAC